jgi:hypothetical protein
MEFLFDQANEKTEERNKENYIAHQLIQTAGSFP